MIKTYSKELKNELDKKNKNAAESVCESVVNIIGEADSIYMYVISNNNYDELVKTTELEKFYRKSGLNIFDQIKFDNSKISLYYIYSKSRNMILSPNGYYDGEFFYKTYYSGAGVTYDEWVETLCDKNSGIISAVNRGKDSFLWYNIQMRSPNVMKNDFVLSFMIDTKAFFENTPYLLGNSKVDLSDVGKNILFSYDFIKDEEVDFSYNKKVTINGKQFFITTEFSSESVNTILKSIKNKMAASTVITLLAGVLFICLALRKSYMPIKSIVSNLDVQNDDGNEFEKIEKYIRKISFDKDELSKIAEKNKETEVCLILQKALSVKLNEHEKQCIDMIKDGEKFFLVSFEMQLQETFCMGEELSLTEKYKELDCVVSNVSYDIFIECLADMIPIKLENQSLFILKVREFDEQNIEYISENIKFIIDFLNSNYGGNCCATVSSMQTSIDGLSQAYSEIIEKKKKRILLSQNIMVHNIDEGNDTSKDGLNIDFKLYDLISSRNFKDAKNEILNILNELRKRKDLSYDVIKGILFHYILVVTELTLDSSETMSDEHIDEVLNNSCDLKTAETFMLERIETMADKSSEKYKGGIERMFVSDVISFVDDNYTDRNLNINSIGRHFGLSPSYISRMFKEKYGESLSDVINIKRVQKAKELLESPKYRIEDVACMVGFGSTRSFNRIFKTVVGVSPKEYSGRP